MITVNKSVLLIFLDFQLSEKIRSYRKVGEKLYFKGLPEILKSSLGIS